MTTTQARPETVCQRSIRRAREQFAGCISEHEMTVLLDTLDDGTPYRHVRFAKPGTIIYSFDLVTWPGHLAISGDLASFTFRRLYDMFDFFRGTGAINPGYWGEKIIAGARDTDLGRTRYSAEQFVETIADHIEGYRQSDWYPRGYNSAEFERFKAAVRDQLLDHPPQYLEEAHHVLGEFRWHPEGREWDDDAFRFTDTYDLSFDGFDHHFLLACHAVQWGVNKYLAEHPDRLIREVR